MRLTDEQIDHLRILGHDLRPAVQVGAGGITRFVLRQIDHALANHELIKVQVPFGNRNRRSDILDSLAPQTDATVVQRASNFVILYRRGEHPVIDLAGVAAIGVAQQRAARQA